MSTTAGFSFGKYYEYIIMNPVRAGLVTNPDDYEWLWYQ